MRKTLAALILILLFIFSVAGQTVEVRSAAGDVESGTMTYRVPLAPKPYKLTTLLSVPERYVTMDGFDTRVYGFMVVPTKRGELFDVAIFPVFNDYPQAGGQFALSLLKMPEKPVRTALISPNRQTGFIFRGKDAQGATLKFYIWVKVNVPIPQN